MTKMFSVFPINLQIFFLFILGAAIGSFLNVLASRYSEKTGFRRALRGRSRCDKCKRTLCWYELIPILSFVALRGQCRTCNKSIPGLYTLVEIIAGLLTVLVPLQIGFTPLALIWVAVFWLLLLLSLFPIILGPVQLVPFVLV